MGQIPRSTERILVYIIILFLLLYKIELSYFWRILGLLLLYICTIFGLFGLFYAVKLFLCNLGY